MAGDTRTELLHEFTAYLRNEGFSVTAQRKAVLTEIAAMGTHFNVEQLAQHLRKTRPPVSRATVYRTVHHLEQAGVIRKIDFDEPHAHYESTIGEPHHEHLICSSCGRVTEVADRALEKRIETIAARHGFSLEKHTVQLFGLCNRCRR